MRIFNRDVHWAEPALATPEPQTTAESETPETRELDQVNDINWLFQQRQAQILGQAVDAIPTVYRGVQYLSDTVASFHMEGINLRTGIILPYDETPQLLYNPQPRWTYHDCISKIMQSLIWDGNAYLIAAAPGTRDKTGNVTSIYVPNPAEVVVAWDKKQLFAEYSWRDQELEHGTEIVHIALNRAAGQLKGIGPITAARNLWEIAHSEADFVKKLWRDELTPTLAIEVEGQLQAGEAKALREQWIEDGADNKLPAVIDNGGKIRPLTINPADAEFLDSRRWTVTEIARMLGIMGFFVGIEMGASMTYSNTEGMNRLQNTVTINPTYLERIEQAFGMLLPRGIGARFNVNEILKADIKTRYEAYKMGIEAGILHPSEPREWERLAPRDDIQPPVVGRTPTDGESNA